METKSKKVRQKLSFQLSNPLRSFDERRARRRLRRSHQTMFEALQSILSRSESTGCTYFELDALYQHIVANHPAQVLELGSGVSTIVLGYAAKEVRALGMPCTIVSMEESQFYYDDLRRLIPEDVADCVELIQSPVEDRRIADEFIARCYRAVPRRCYDLAFIDGPQVPKMEEDARYLDGDVLDAINWNDRAFTAFLDSRKGTRLNLERLLPWARFHYNRRHKFTRIDIPPRVARGDHADFIFDSRRSA